MKVVRSTGFWREATCKMPTWKVCFGARASLSPRPVLGAKPPLGSRSRIWVGEGLDSVRRKARTWHWFAVRVPLAPPFSLPSWKSSQNPREKELAVGRSSARLGASLMLRSGVAFRMPPPAATIERPTTRPLPLVQLGLHQCKWPTEINLQVVGGYLFCAEATGGHVYCARHRKLKSGQPSRPR